MQQKAIIVIGMHRSGTSAISGLLAELGVFMGSSLFAPQKGVNEKGFYENSLVVEMNERLFDEKCWSWDDPLAHAFADNNDSAIQKALPHAADMLKTDYGNKPLWGMKDPRTTLLMPFWKQVFNKLNVKTTYVLMVRPPVEVCGSLTKRNGFSLDKSLMLWLNHTFTGYFCCDEQERCIVTYPDLLEQPKAMARRIAECAALDIDIDSMDLNFVDKSMQNQKQKTMPAGELSDIAVDLYTALSQPEVNDDDVRAVKARYEQYLSRMNPVLVEHLRSVKQEEVYFRHLFVNAYRSVWWKLSWPLKKIEMSLRKKKWQW
ncbi:sulfotransferase family protein [Alteromonas confluentis]|uniref:Sulfotransferase family protein n=1 Tax=Alteromonas confluentis TaxID=1656094 RepID=A0A1E7ZA86_9ALTE|nr:sulfotransferase [Alteromonas confluentis]OFC70430.1 hypothetical protein BFC18_14805 [Alteromonas confluentis]